MPVDKKLLAQALRNLEQDVEAHRRRRALWRERLYAEEPRLLELDTRIRDVFLDALAKLDPRTVEEAAAKSLLLQKEREELLCNMGALPGSLEDTPLCPVCRDSGFAEGEPCECLLERYQVLQAAELSALLDLRGQSFDSFNAELFSDTVDKRQNGSPRQNIEAICELCYNYSQRFASHSDNLLFSGPPGTGKTFLSSCVAGAVNKQGYSVVYDTAVRHLSHMEAYHFGRGDEETERAVKRLRESDLLIIDDFGMEFITPFAQSALLDIVNTRLLSDKKMLVSTNLSRNDIYARYSPALASRMEGEFLWLDFFGEDLRGRQH